MVELYSGDCLEMAGCFFMIMDGDAQSMLRSPGSEHFQSVELYLGDSFEMAVYSAVLVGET